MNFEKYATFLKAIANAKRLEILNYLSHHEMSVTDLQQRLTLSQSALSQHLALLRKAKIVQTRREKQKIIYRIANQPTQKILHFIYEDSKI
ncbi:MAG: winged helix-turn-helix transcriptional regulator [Alphaproteobacteria bacterium]|nr:winged helix-turn-helix transcriptional regulator [Alphaproteobacteria bacterium]